MDDFFAKRNSFLTHFPTSTLAHRPSLACSLTLCVCRATLFTTALIHFRAILLFVKYNTFFIFVFFHSPFSGIFRPHKSERNERKRAAERISVVHTDTDIERD